MRACIFCILSELNGPFFVIKRIPTSRSIEIRSWGDGDGYLCEKCLATISQFGKTIKLNTEAHSYDLDVTSERIRQIETKALRKIIPSSFIYKKPVS